MIKNDYNDEHIPERRAARKPRETASQREPTPSYEDLAHRGKEPAERFTGGV